MASLVVVVPEFSGPLDLLLTMIRTRRLEVTAVSLATVADQYLQQVLALEGELEALSEFLRVASQLLLIKSRALLPQPPVVDAEGDPAEELRRRLAEYQIMQGAAAWLAQREGEAQRAWPRGSDVAVAAEERALLPVGASRLARLAATLLGTKADEPDPLVLPPRPVLRERALVVLETVRRDQWLPWSGLLGRDVPTAVATVLAVLVLVRVGLLEVRQSAPYETVELRRVGSDALALPSVLKWD